MRVFVIFLFGFIILKIYAFSDDLFEDIKSFKAEGGPGTEEVNFFKEEEDFKSGICAIGIRWRSKYGEKGEARLIKEFSPTDFRGKKFHFY